MKIYLASSFKFIPRIERLTNLLEIDGFEITLKWWKRIYQTEELGQVKTSDLKKIYADLDPSEFYSKPETKQSYLSDLKAIEESEALILVAPDKASRNDFVGANIELGYALALGIHCLSIGELNKSAMYHGVKKCETYIDLLSELKLLEWDQK